MVFITAVCFIIRRHRRRLAHRETTAVGTGRMNEHENTSDLMDAGSARIESYHAILSGAILSDETLVQEPPPAYIPAGDYLMMW